MKQYDFFESPFRQFLKRVLRAVINWIAFLTVPVWGGVVIFFYVLFFVSGRKDFFTGAYRFYDMD